MALTKTEHKDRHMVLHQSLDELVADYVTHEKKFGSLSTASIMDLIKWSNQQTINPTELD